MMQNKVRKFNKERSFDVEPMPVAARVMDIQSEMGELAKECLKTSNYGSNDFYVTEDFEMEFGDVLYSLLSLAEEVHISAEKCLDKALYKYKERLSKHNSMGSEVES